jgi:hypothetical protein
VSGNDAHITVSRGSKRRVCSTLPAEVEGRVTLRDRGVSGARLSFIAMAGGHVRLQRRVRDER